METIVWWSARGREFNNKKYSGDWRPLYGEAQGGEV